MFGAVRMICCAHARDQRVVPGLTDVSIGVDRGRDFVDVVTVTVESRLAISAMASARHAAVDSDFGAIAAD
jgi:hypothetical protein